MSTITIMQLVTYHNYEFKLKEFKKNEVKLCETRVLYAFAYFQLKESFSVALPR